MPQLWREGPVADWLTGVWERGVSHRAERCCEFLHACTCMLTSWNSLPHTEWNAQDGLCAEAVGGQAECACTDALHWGTLLLVGPEQCQSFQEPGLHVMKGGVKLQVARQDSAAARAQYLCGVAHQVTASRPLHVSVAGVAALVASPAK